VRIKRTIYYEIEGLGAQIREARKKSPKSVTTLASDAGMSVANWYRIEGEKVDDALPEETLDAIGAVLGIDIWSTIAKDPANASLPSEQGDDGGGLR